MSCPDPTTWPDVALVAVFAAFVAFWMWRMSRL